MQSNTLTRASEITNQAGQKNERMSHTQSFYLHDELQQEGHAYPCSGGGGTAKRSTHYTGCVKLLKRWKDFVKLVSQIQFEVTCFILLCTSTLLQF